MSDQKIPMLREIIEERKTRAVETLSAGYAKNRLPLEEYERLVEYINKIESERELAVVEKIVAEYRVPEENISGQDQDSGMSGSSQNYQFDDDDYVSRDDHRNNLQINPVILSTRTYAGPIKSGAEFISILGSQHIEIRKSDLGKRQTNLDIVNILGETVILVEPGIRVMNRAIPILGSADINQKVKASAHSNGPEIVISGATMLGSISVKLLKN